MLRKIFILSLLICSSWVWSQSFLIPAEGAKWNEADVDLESIMHTQHSLRIEVNGDTIIDTLKYSRLLRTWSASFYQNGPCQFQYISGPTSINDYIGAVKTNEDQQVFFISKEDSIAYIIYDFSLSVGDTINWERPHGYESFRASVSEIDSFLVDGIYRKQINLEVYNNLPDQWIEGIGSIFGLFSTFGYRSWEKVIHELMCYRDNSVPELLFHNYACSICDVVTSSKDVSIIDRLIIYPMPFEDQAVVELQGTANPSHYRVYDLSGRIVFSDNLSGSEPLILHQEDYERGLIFLVVIDQNNKAYKAKIIVN